MFVHKNSSWYENWQFSLKEVQELATCKVSGYPRLHEILVFQMHHPKVLELEMTQMPPTKVLVFIAPGGTTQASQERKQPAALFSYDGSEAQGQPAWRHNPNGAAVPSTLWL